MPKPSSPTPITVGQMATLACLMEVTTPKPGNVHRGADFEDTTFFDFAASAVAIAQPMEAAAQTPLGETVLQAVQATRQAVGRNTNLGTVLLLAPLAKAPRESPLAAGVAEVLASLTPEDARDVYEAIRLAQPGGLGTAPQADVADAPPADLIAAMRLAADRDMVARQYAEGFAQVLGFVVPLLGKGIDRGWPLGQTIIHVQMQLMSQFPDSLIERKLGPAVARRSAEMAQRVIASGQPGEQAWGRALADFDFWLRSDGHRRNPGTTADLLAAGLFAALREGVITSARLD